MNVQTLFDTARRHALDDAGDPDEYWSVVERLWSAEPREVWTRIEPLADADDPRLQQLAVDVASRLGHEGQPMFFETLKLFARVVERGPKAEVLAAVADACVHFHDRSLVTLLAPHAKHPDRAVREAVLHAIRRSPAPEAVEALIHLSTDEVDELREWATFALGSQLPLVDAPEIRAALAARLTDRHEATRDEAVIGLGLRADARALGPLMALLARGAAGVPLFQAAEALGSSVLLPALTGLKARAGTLDDAEREALTSAIAACSPRDPA